MERWFNRVAVVTGASCGIGAACAKLLVENGMIVVGLARRSERMENEVKASLTKEQQVRFHAVKCDVSKEDDIIKAFAWVENKLGGVDVLVNNAGIGRQGIQIVSENNSADLKSIIDTNVLGPAYCTREAFRSMKKHNYGHVVLVNSVAGHKIPVIPGLNVNIYGPSKFAITAMTEVLRQEFMNNNTKIKVTSFTPGMVDTEFRNKSKVKPNTPMLSPEDCADAILYCIQTPPNVQIHELTMKPVGEPF